MSKWINPIQTYYNGYRFRSRLEARWAVFFDALGIEYEYEPEGYEMSDGTRYLPDFYLPYDKTYVEVKANRDGCAKEMYKVVKFVDKTGSRVLVLTDVPDAINDDIYWYPILFKDGLSGEVIITRVTFFPYEDSNLILFYGVSHDPCNYAMSNCSFNFLSRFRFENIKPVKESYMYRNSPCCYLFEDDELAVETMNNALLAARRARFEHGETPFEGG